MSTPVVLTAGQLARAYRLFRIQANALHSANAP
jgi:hypothetical protein